MKKLFLNVFWRKCVMDEVGPGRSGFVPIWMDVKVKMIKTNKKYEVIIFPPKIPIFL
jgi:hypothetical protein